MTFIEFFSELKRKLQNTLACIFNAHIATIEKMLAISDKLSVFVPFFSGESILRLRKNIALSLEPASVISKIF